MKKNQVGPDGLYLPLVECFYSLQGEGHHTGKAACFIRLGGCDVGCSWCDTRFSWDPEVHQVTGTDQIVEKVIETGADSVVVTGGEPLTWNLDYLCRQIKNRGLKTYLETSGAYPLSGDWDWICLSPKRNMPPVPAIYQMAHELKVIIHDESDLEWAEYNRQLVAPGCLLYLQPEWSVYKSVIHTVVEYIKKHKNWIISLQAHKFMKIP